MEIATLFLIWIAITVLDNLLKRKKRRLPPPESSPDFEIPTIKCEEVPIFIENPRQAEIRSQNFEPSSKKLSAQVISKAEETNELDLNLTPSNVLNAFVLSEILDKPKALRRRNF